MATRRWINTQAVADQLNVDEYTVRTWLRAGRLPEAARLPGGQWRVPADAAARFLRPGSEYRESHPPVTITTADGTD
jgi:excisionase family DNA binding protein